MSSGRIFFDQKLIELIAAGPKQYAYRVRTAEGKEEIVLKLRGFSLSYNNGQKLHLAEMRRMVTAMVKQTDNNQSVTLIYPTIVRNPDRSIVTKTATKVYRPVYSKRRILPDFSTLPYGYVD